MSMEGMGLDILSIIEVINENLQITQYADK